MKEKSVNRDALKEIHSKGLEHLKLACEKYVPLKQWDEAEYHFKLAFEYYSQLPNSHGPAVVELYLQWMYYDSGQDVDLNKILKASKYLIDIAEMVAEIGTGLMQELLSDKYYNYIIEKWIRMRNERWMKEKKARLMKKSKL